MGCNGSKAEDINKSQVDRKKGAPPAASGKSAAKSEPDRERQDREIEAKLKDQRSPTDARDSEAERFKDIIEKTAQNFVDISSVTQIPNVPPPEPGKKKYAVEFGTSTAVPAAVSHSLNALPAVAAHNFNTALFTSAPAASDKELLEKIGVSLVSSYTRMGVTPCGELVVHFPEITA